MSEILRLKANWTGISGGTGTTTLHCRNNSAITPTIVQNSLENLRLMFENTSEWLPNDVTITFPSSQDVIDPSTGGFLGVVTATTGVSSLTGAYTGNWQNGVGTRVVWNTGEVGAHRRIRGCTYLVPYGGIFDNDGTMSSAATSDLVTNATAFLTNQTNDDAVLVVYSYDTHNEALVLSASVSDKPVVLRTRRD